MKIYLASYPEFKLLDISDELIYMHNVWIIVQINTETIKYTSCPFFF